MKRLHSAVAFFGLAAVITVGCTDTKSSPAAADRGTAANRDDVATERAKLSAEDRELVEAQEWCAVSTDERLGSMGPPIKLTIKGEPVFICCKGCQKKAEANPDKTLAKVEELKAKAKTENAATK
jgi:hypothetical protein